MTHLRIAFLLSILTIHIGCSSNHGMKRIKVDNTYVEAKFIDGTTIDGKAIYYDSLGEMYNITTYKNGTKEGTSINYYPNKKVSDSVEYKSGKESGYWKYYDQQGNNVYGNFYYYGLRFGPELIFENKKLKRFLFSDLNRRNIIACKFDSVGKIDTGMRFTMQFSLNLVTFENKPSLNLFGYLPKIPHSEQSYTIGVTNDKHADRELAIVAGHDFLIDTLLTLPPKGWHYYVACNLKANNGDINKIYIEELVY
jgi:hypothetical protein